MPARLRVNRKALAANYRQYRAAVAGECGAVVKADGYGLGAEETAAVLQRLGCGHFFVATAAEGLALKRRCAAVQSTCWKARCPIRRGRWPRLA